MSERALGTVVRNIDERLARVERYLPKLVTRGELEAAVALLATREELQAAIAPLATREELHAAVRAEGEAARRHATVLYESLRDDNRLIVEHLLALSARVDSLARR